MVLSVPKKAKVSMLICGAVSISIFCILILPNIDFDIMNNRLSFLDLQYSLISFSATLGGFMFTGISILISVIDHSAIKASWKYGYYDKLCVSSFIGIILNIIIVLFAVIIVFNIYTAIHKYLYVIQICLIFLVLVYFGVTIKQLVHIIIRIKKKS